MLRLAILAAIAYELAPRTVFKSGNYGRTTSINDVTVRLAAVGTAAGSGRVSGGLLHFSSEIT